MAKSRMKTFLDNVRGPKRPRLIEYLVRDQVRGEREVEKVDSAKVRNQDMFLLWNWIFGGRGDRGAGESIDWTAL